MNGNGRPKTSGGEQRPWWERGSAVAALAFLLNAVACEWYLMLVPKAGGYGAAVMVTSFVAAFALGSISYADK